jgi:hypothetical protein
MLLDMTMTGQNFSLLDPDASVIRDSLPRVGYEPAVCVMLQAALGRSPSTVFFDVGAHHGIFSVWAARCGAIVYSFEPNSISAEILRLNLTRNNCSGQVVQMALSDARGTSELRGSAIDRHSHVAKPKRGYIRGVVNYLSPASHGYGASIAQQGPAWRSSITDWLTAVFAEHAGLYRGFATISEGGVPTETMDDWCDCSHVRPAVVKIDVHGAEVAVIRGMRQVLRSCVLDVVVEVHTQDLLITGSHEELVEELEAADMEVFELVHFRRKTGRLVRLTGRARQRFCDQNRWTAEDLYFMRCLYARRTTKQRRR